MSNPYSPLSATGIVQLTFEPEVAAGLLTRLLLVNCCWRQRDGVRRG